MPRYEQAGQFFWTIEIAAATVTTTVGKIGNDGHTRAKFHGTIAAAKREAERLIAEKVEQGYVLTSASQSKTRPARPRRPRSRTAGSKAAAPRRRTP